MFLMTKLTLILTLMTLMTLNLTLNDLYDIHSFDRVFMSLDDLSLF